MTPSQQDVLLYAIKEITEIQNGSTQELKSWLSNRGVEISERTFVPPAGQPAFSCTLIAGQVTLHTSSSFTPDAALIQCAGEYCKNLLIERYMNS